jgi:predicted PurR-regulated permease PerM
LSDRDFVRRTLIVLGLIVLGLFLWITRHVVLLIFGAVLVAILLDTLASPLARRLGLPRALAVSLGAALGIAVLALLWLQFGPQLQRQVADIAAQVPDAWSRLGERISAIRPLENLLDQALQGMVDSSGGLISRVAGLLGSLAGVVVDLLLVLFGGIYLAVQPGLYRYGLLGPLDGGDRRRVRRLLDDCGEALRGWLLAQFLAMLVVGSFVGTGLWLIGVPSPWALGVLAGAAEFVPLLGPVLAAIPAVVLALGQDWITAAWTIGLYIAVQQLEGNILWPLLGRRVIDLPPALCLFSIVALGLVLGPLGVLFAIPLTVVLLIIARTFLIEDRPSPEAPVGK